MTVLDLDSAVAGAVTPSRASAMRRLAPLVPVAAVLAALLVGAALIIIEGAPPLDVYRTVVRGVTSSSFGWRDTLVQATPLATIGIGLAVAYRARVFTIGAEGQYLIGATAATAVVTAPALVELPGAVLVPLGVVVAIAAGAAWSGISAGLNSRFGTSVVISSLLLNYVAAAVLAWAIRTTIRDPDGFVPQSRPLGGAVLGTMPGVDVHAGVLAVVVLLPVTAIALTRTRAGFLVDIHGHNPDALDAHEAPRRRVLWGVLLACGAIAGLAGFVQTAGVTERLTADAGVGYGFTAIVVAVLGRLRPLGVVIAALLLAAMTIGFESAEREFGLPASLVGIIEALIVLFIVVGDGMLVRWGDR